MGTEIASKVQHVKNDFRIIDLNLDIADKTTEFLKRIKYKNLKNPGLADIIIAATACVYDMPLITNNPKDYKYFPEVHIMKP
jgi:predicted nucleic acid-binding protein